VGFALSFDFVFLLSAIFMNTHAFSVTRTAISRVKTACAVVGVFAPRKLSPAAEALDGACNGALRQVLASGELDPKPGQVLMLHRIAGLACERVLLVGLGAIGKLDAAAYRKATAAAMRALVEARVKEAVWSLADLPVKGGNAVGCAEQSVLAAHGATYRFDQLKSEVQPVPVLASIKLTAADAALRTELERGLAQGAAIAAGMTLARNLGNLPGNLCTPSVLADEAQQLGETMGFGVEVLERVDLERLGMGSFLSVAKGSDEAPKFIIMNYAGGKPGEKPVVLVGKGITFDAGGISLKPAAEMDEMKYDMSGAASVLGAFQALAQLALPINVVGLIPTCENLPSGRANKPGDIVTSMSGQTIEVLNTDAEGRLILCDALTYAERFEPAAVVDVATLTGACVIALGHVVSGVLGNDDRLVRELIKAGETASDPCWQLPLFDEYQEQLKSNFADMANIGGRPGGTITAAAFLSRFAKKYKWAHLDIAGTAWKSGKDKGSTGRPVPLLVHFLLGQCMSRA
jgi:leucyl aminopeptidase